MKKIYVVAPLAGLLVFSGVYWQHHRAHEARLAAQREQQQLDKQRKHAQESAARLAAQQAASVALEQRKLERAEKERHDAAQKRARQNAEQRRQDAFENEQRLRTRLERLNADLQLEEALFARAEERKRELAHEQRFLVQHVKTVEANRDASFQALQRIELSERARAAAPQTKPQIPAKNG